VVTTRRSQRLPGALALAAVLLAACDGAAPPQTGSRPESAASESTEVAPPGAAAADPRPARVFDAGEIKTAAQYLLEPELAGADPKRGQLLSLACAACHTFGAGENAIIGPNLHGVFGRPAAAVADFNYSQALRASQLVWTPRALEAWLADPANFVPGTTMTFTGYRSPADRRDLIAYLLSATQ
jgi:cytochrome c